MGKMLLLMVVFGFIFSGLTPTFSIKDFIQDPLAQTQSGGAPASTASPASPTPHPTPSPSAVPLT